MLKQLADKILTMKHRKKNKGSKISVVFTIGGEEYIRAIFHSGNHG